MLTTYLVCVGKLASITRDSTAYHSMKCFRYKNRETFQNLDSLFQSLDPSYAICGYIFMRTQEDRRTKFEVHSFAIQKVHTGVQVLNVSHVTVTTL